VIQDPAEFIVNAEKVSSIFGEWPTFHDAEVLTLILNRGMPHDFKTSMLVRVWTFKVHRDQTDSKGYYKTTDHSIVTFRFDEPDELNLQGFNHQNVLFDITFKLVDTMVDVTFEGIYGVHTTFRCQKVTVEAVEAA
jgi:hypothetical protein